MCQKSDWTINSRQRPVSLLVIIVPILSTLTMGILALWPGDVSWPAIACFLRLDSGLLARIIGQQGSASAKGCLVITDYSKRPEYRFHR